jgi:fumarylacetoacetase
MQNGRMNETHDPALRSWVASANREGNGFPIQNLPFAVFRPAPGDALRIGVAIGDDILDVSACDGLPAREAFAQPALNAFMALGPSHWRSTRLALSRGLREGAAQAIAWRSHLVPRARAQLALPARIGDYTDFYTSVHHATNVGRLFRPDNPLLPNYKWVPIGYHGRSSTIEVSGTDFHRPQGQVMPPGETVPRLGPSKRLDYELELGLFIGQGNETGQRVPIEDAGEHLFGACLLNDWSARDIQAWEYQPLGPFLSKNFASTISPWVVTMEALEPFRIPWTRAADDPQPLAYLDSPATRSRGAIDIRLEVLVETRRMRDNRVAPQAVSRTSYRHAYWTAEQLVAHHTVNGCGLRPGDLLGTGTLSGPEEGEAGSLVELTRGGKEAIVIGGDKRTFLEDGDRVVFRGWCEKPGLATISLGEASASVLPALE